MQSQGRVHKISLIYHHKKEGFWNQEQKNGRTRLAQIKRTEQANQGSSTVDVEGYALLSGRCRLVHRDLHHGIPVCPDARIFCNIRMPTAWALSAGAGLTGDRKRLIPPKKTLTPYVGFVRCAFQLRRSDGHCNAVFVCGLQTCFTVPPFWVGESTNIRLIKNYFITKS